MPACPRAQSCWRLGKTDRAVSAVHRDSKVRVLSKIDQWRPDSRVQSLKMWWQNISPLGAVWMTVLAVAAFAANVPEIPPALPCADGVSGAPACTASKKDLKEAKSRFALGRKLQNAKRLDEAFAEFEHAADLVPQDLEYVTARELARQQLVFNHIQHGNQSLTAGRQVEAMAESRSALQLDPQNQFAQERLLDALGSRAPKTSASPQLVRDEEEPQLAPPHTPSSFHYRGDSRGLLSQVASAYGIEVTMDDSVTSRPVRVDIE